MATDREKRERQEREARDALRRLDESETVGTSSFARAANRAKDHFGGADAPENDPIEIWGRRIGRILGAIFAIGLVIYLVTTYIIP